MPRKGAGQLPALLLDLGSPPETHYLPLGRNASQLALRGRGSLYVVGETTPDHHVLRTGLRPLVVGMANVGFGPLPHPRIQLRTFPRGARRAGHHPRQERAGRLAAADGALARGAWMVRCSSLAPGWARSCRDGA